MMKSTPVRCSSERMFLPSRPMIRPLRSSEASSTTVTVASAVWLAATRWSESATSARARRRASERASSSICRTSRASSWRTRSFERSSSCWRASWTVRPEIFSSDSEGVALRLAELLLQRLDVHLAIAESLLLPLELDQPRVGLVLLLQHALLDLGDLDPAVLHLALDLAAERDGLLARLDLRLAANGFGLAASVVEEALALSPGGTAPATATRRGDLRTPRRPRWRSR